MQAVTAAQLEHDPLHGLLNRRRQGIVTRAGRAVGDGLLFPRLAVGRNQFQAAGGGRQRLPAAQGLQFRQRRRELQGRNQRQPFAVKQPQEQFQDVLAHRILARGKEHAAVVFRRGLQQPAGIDRAAFVPHGDHRAVVAGVFQVLDESQSGLVERHPVGQAAPAAGVQSIAGREGLGQQRPVKVDRHQPGVLGVGDGPCGQARRPGQDAQGSHHRRGVVPAIGDQQERRVRARPEDQPMPLGTRRRGVHGGGHVHARMQADRRDHARRIGLHDADAQGLRRDARILDLHHVRHADAGDGQRIRLPTARQQLDELPAGSLAQAAQAVADGRFAAARVRPRQPFPVRQLGKRFPESSGGAAGGWARRTGGAGRCTGIHLRLRLGHHLPRGGSHRRRLGTKHHQLDDPSREVLGGREPRGQTPFAERDVQIVNAFLIGHHQRPRTRFLRFAVRPHTNVARLLPQLGFGSRRREADTADQGIVGLDAGNQVRSHVKLELLARIEYQRITLETDPQFVPRIAPHQEPIATLIQQRRVRLGQQLAQRDLNSLDGLRGLVGSQQDGHLGGAGRRDPKTHAVIRARRAGNQHDCVTVDVHRTRFVRRQADRLKFPDTTGHQGLGLSMVDANLASPTPRSAAAPGDPDPHVDFLAKGGTRRQKTGAENQRSHPTGPPPAAFTAVASCWQGFCHERTSLSEHRSKLSKRAIRLTRSQRRRCASDTPSPLAPGQTRMCQPQSRVAQLLLPLACRKNTPDYRRLSQNETTPNSIEAFQQQL